LFFFTFQVLLSLHLLIILFSKTHFTTVVVQDKGKEILFRLSIQRLLFYTKITSTGSDGGEQEQELLQQKIAGEQDKQKEETMKSIEIRKS